MISNAGKISKLGELSSEVLEKIGNISEEARSQRTNSGGPHAGSIANFNSINSEKVLEHINEMVKEQRNSAEVLLQEPAIARILVEDEDGLERIYYVCRATPVDGIPNLASYRSPIGRLASLPIGATMILPTGQEIEITGKCRLKPKHDHDGWDSIDTIVENESLGVVTVASLRRLLDPSGSPDGDGDILGELLAEEGQERDFVEGINPYDFHHLLKSFV